MLTADQCAPAAAEEVQYVLARARKRQEDDWTRAGIRRSEGISRRGPLFVSMSRAHPHERLTADGLYCIVMRLAQAAGCKASPHGLRHTAITDAILMQHSLADVQKFSRHTDLRTLQLYYDRVRGVAKDIATDIVSGL